MSIQTSYARLVSARFGILSARYRSIRFLTIRTSPDCGFGASAFGNSISCAARRAALLLGYSERVPIRRVRRLPPFHQRKFHVLRLLSKTTLPVLNRAALLISPSFPQGTRMAFRMVARCFPEGPRLSPTCESARSCARYQTVQRLSPFLRVPKAAEFALSRAGIRQLRQR